MAVYSFFLDIRVPKALALNIYGTSQLAKYIPGNIFHLAKRQILGATHGLGHGPLAKSAVVELLLIGLGGVVFAPLALPLVSVLVGPGLVIGGVTAFATAYAASTALVGGRALAVSSVCYMLFFSGTGFVFVLTFALATGSFDIPMLSAVIGAYVVAWTVGFLTPGAPAGLGVREAALLFLLKDVAPESVVLLAAALMRAINIGGDFALFLAGRAVKLPSQFAHNGQ